MNQVCIKLKIILSIFFFSFLSAVTLATPIDFICSGYIDTSYIEITKVNCETNTDICLNIPLGDFLSYTVTDNGSPYSGGVSACDFDTSFAYTYFTLPGSGLAGPYLIDSWDVDGNIYSGQVSNMSDLTDSMNIWDPVGNWILDGSTSSIRGGITSVNYGNMEVTQISSGTSSTINVTTSLNPNGSLITLDTGYHELIFTEPVEGCLDTITVLIDCTGCPDSYSGNANLMAINCFSNTVVCFDIPISAAQNYTILDNGILYSGTIQECSVDSSFSYDYSGIPDQGTLGPYQLQNWMVNGSVFLGVFGNMSELVTAMNIWDPGGNWILDAGTFTINGGNGANSYSNIEILQIMSGNSGTATLSATASVTSIELQLLAGDHELIFENSQTFCLDTVSLFIDCVPCPDIFGASAMSAQASHCDSSTALCLPIPYAEIDDYEVFVNGVDYMGNFQSCGSDSTLITLDTGFYHIVLTNTITACMDSVDLTISCVPEAGCGSFLSDEVRYLSVEDCNEMASLCIGIPFSDFNNYTIFDNNILYENGVMTCDVDSIVSSLILGQGIHELTFEHNTTFCRDTVNVMVACISSENLNSTVLVNEIETICIDSSQLMGTVSGFENICEAASGEFSIVDLDSENFCINLTGVEAGTENACLVLCDDLGYCDTTFINILIQNDLLLPNAADDFESGPTNAPMTIDVLENDEINGFLDTFYILTNPSNGTAFLNNDGSITYVPQDEFCNSNIPDAFDYVICNADGCDSATVEVTVFCEAVRVHNGFSPNGDGKNDSFVIKGVEDLPGNRLMIYNRWGNLVFNTENYQNDWQGTWNGTNLLDGTYFYVFDDGAGNVQSGFVQINR